MKICFLSKEKKRLNRDVLKNVIKRAFKGRLRMGSKKMIGGEKEYGQRLT
jgi:hypothetical protein